MIDKIILFGELEGSFIGVQVMNRTLEGGTEATHRILKRKKDTRAIERRCASQRENGNLDIRQGEQTDDNFNTAYRFRFEIDSARIDSKRVLDVLDILSLELEVLINLISCNR